ncbi:MAG: hypothetical protein FD172_2391 [Methylocystaceae bacterium]|nr:MAG: hypothetical protein FD172_2391 [Methylocystaceae bacterium]
MKLIATIALSFMLALAGSALAEDYENAVSATRRGEFAGAFKLLKPLAEKGDARAQADVGAMYLTGKGVAANPKEALKWLRLAADHGNASAQFNLGTMYLEGQVVMRDYKEAMKWNLLAAGQGLAAAQVNIASMYYDGVGVAQDYKEAAKWLRLAAEQGDADAQLNLGNMYVAGQGVERDLLRGRFRWARPKRRRCGTCRQSHCRRKTSPRLKPWSRAARNRSSRTATELRGNAPSICAVS